MRSPHTGPQGRSGLMTCHKVKTAGGVPRNKASAFLPHVQAWRGRESAAGWGQKAGSMCKAGPGLHAQADEDCGSQK